LPSITFVIGGGVSSAIDGAALAANGIRNVRVTGHLSEVDKLAYLGASDLAINPMFSGSGTNIKMFDFMAAGLPIVSTPIGARGISQGSETVFSVCDKEHFARGVQQVLNDPLHGASLGQAARRRVQEAFSWERLSANLGVRLRRTRAKFETTAPFFSVIVPTYERHAHLPALMDCLRKQQCQDFEIVIVDQSRQPWAALGQFADLDVCYLHTDVKGAVKARNAGAFHARGDVLAFTDDDTQPYPDWLGNAVKYFADPAVAGVEGLILSDKEGDPAYRPVTNQGFEGIGFMTANLLIRRAVFGALDGFDERFDNPHFREDTDLGWRAQEHGSIPFGQDVRVFHPPHRRDIVRESLAERNRFFEKDALLLEKHPVRYRTLFLGEGHYRHTKGFWENFLRGAKKYRVELEPFYRASIPAEFIGID
jgi:glycosyltransferase involved in cell wall biosynthesis